MTVSAYYLPTSVSVSGTPWTDSANVEIDDDLFAYSVAARELNYPYGYTSIPTGRLACSSFTGIAAGIADGDTIDGIEIEVRAKQSRTDVDVDLVLYSSSVLEANEAQRLTDAWATYTFGGPTYLMGIAPHLANAGYVLTFLNAMLRGVMTSGVGEATVSVEYVKVRVYWTATACNAFSFTPAVNQALHEWIYSDIITVAGLPADFEAPTSFSFSGSSAVLTTIEAMHNNDGRWMTTVDPSIVTSVNGDTWQLRRMLHFARAADQAYLLHPLSINGTEATWQVDSIAIDNTSPTFVLRDSTVPRGQSVKAPFTIRVADINCINYFVGDLFAESMAAAFVGSAGELMRLTDTHDPTEGGPGVRGPFDDAFSYPVYNGTDIECWVTTPAGFGAATVSTLFVGSQSPAWTFTTEAADLVPTQVYFATPAAVGTGVVTTSPLVTILGINDTATVTFDVSGGTNHEFQKNGGAWTAVGGGTTVVTGNTMKVRMTSPAGAPESGNLTMKIGTMHATFCIVTTAGDVTPDAFTFTDVADAIPGLLYTSNAQVLAGVTAAQPILATVSPGFEIRVGAGAWTASSLSVMNGDSITIRGYAPMQAGTTATCVVTIGGTQDTWTITSRKAHAFWD